MGETQIYRNGQPTTDANDFLQDIPDIQINKIRSIEEIEQRITELKERLSNEQSRPLSGAGANEATFILSDIRYLTDICLFYEFNKENIFNSLINQYKKILTNISVIEHLSRFDNDVKKLKRHLKTLNYLILDTTVLDAEIEQFERAAPNKQLTIE